MSICSYCSEQGNHAIDDSFKSQFHLSIMLFSVKMTSIILWNFSILYFLISLYLLVVIFLKYFRLSKGEYFWWLLVHKCLFVQCMNTAFFSYRKYLIVYLYYVIYIVFFYLIRFLWRENSNQKFKRKKMTRSSSNNIMQFKW